MIAASVAAVAIAVIAWDAWRRWLLHIAAARVDRDALRDVRAHVEGVAAALRAESASDGKRIDALEKRCDVVEQIARDMRVGKALR